MITKNWFGKGKFGLSGIKRAKSWNYGGWGEAGACYRDSFVIFVIAYSSLFGIPICLTANKTVAPCLKLTIIHIVSW